MQKFLGCTLVAATLLTFAGSMASAQDLDKTRETARIVEACGIELKLSAAGCRCLADAAIKDLSDFQREYLVATTIAPSAAERMRASVSQDDMQILARFLASTAQKCSVE